MNVRCPESASVAAASVRCWTNSGATMLVTHALGFAIVAGQINPTVILAQLACTHHSMPGTEHPHQQWCWLGIPTRMLGVHLVQVGQVHWLARFVFVRKHLIVGGGDSQVWRVTVVTGCRANLQ